MEQIKGAQNLKHKILYCMHFGDVSGGGEISLLNLLKELDRDRYDPVMMLPWKGDLEDAATELDIPVTIIPFPPVKHPLGLFRISDSVMKLKRLMVREKVDLMHMNAAGRIALAAGLAAKMAGIPSLYHIRIMDPDVPLDSICFGLYTKIITNSDATATRFAGFSGASKKVQTVYNPVDMSAFEPGPANPDVRKQLGADEGDILIGVVGWLHEFKGHKYFIDAAARLADVPNLKFVIVGEGTLRAKLQKQAKCTPAADRIIFAGHRKDMPDVMRALDILVLSSVQEHFGRVLIEAMACEKPVIGTRAGGVPEIIVHGETGLMAPPCDGAALADAIRTMTSDPAEMARMGKAGLARAKAMFTAEQHARGIQDAYSKLLAK